MAKDGPVYYVSPLLEGRGVRHVFSTRMGGISPPPFDSLNLGNPSGCEIQDNYARIYENYKLLQTAIGCASEMRCWVHQVHGGDCVVIRAGEEFLSGTKADAMVSDDAARVLSVRAADCVPVLMASDDGAVVAAVHAGWRGVIAGAVTNALAAMMEINSSRPYFPFRENQGSSRGIPRRINSSRPYFSPVAAIGPCIGFDAFEVGGEVLEQFAAQGLPLRRREDGKGHVDLREAIRLQLIRAGVSEDRIDTTDRCTFRDADEFFSHRRDRGATGRMAALIAPATRPPA